ncbi:MAG: hypothetical protein H7123_02845, partial [Thermoleophilia bacterium]|nr:hypothetical protein [Thermoleophilia bacterium]
MAKISASTPKIVTPKPAATDKPATDTSTTNTQGTAQARNGANAVGDVPSTTSAGHTAHTATA